MKYIAITEIVHAYIAIHTCILICKMLIAFTCTIIKMRITYNDSFTMYTSYSRQLK